MDNKLILDVHLHVGCYYFTIANIRPVFRSSLRSIFLLAIAKTTLLKEFSADAILECFVTQMNMLSKVTFYIFSSILIVHVGL